MPPEPGSRAEHAAAAQQEELKVLIHEGDENTLLALLENPNLDETLLARMLDRLDLTSNVLSAVAGKPKWTASEAIRLRLARHPRTPRRIAMSAVKQLFLFDLVRLSLLPSVPAEIKRVAEETILQRIPNLPIGEKLTLARRGPARVAGAILAEGHPQALKLALGNAFLTESQVLKVLAKPGAPERVVSAIAQHPKWSCQYNVRVALVRNPRTPAPCVLAFLPNLTLRDLKDIVGLEGLAPHAKRYIQQELAHRAGR